MAGNGTDQTEGGQGATLQQTADAGLKPSFNFSTKTGFLAAMNSLDAELTQLYRERQGSLPEGKTSFFDAAALVDLGEHLYNPVGQTRIALPVPQNEIPQTPTGHIDTDWVAVSLGSRVYDAMQQLGVKTAGTTVAAEALPNVEAAAYKVTSPSLAQLVSFAVGDLKKGDIVSLATGADAEYKLPVEERAAFFKGIGEKNSLANEVLDSLKSTEQGSGKVSYVEGSELWFSNGHSKQVEDLPDSSIRPEEEATPAGPGIGQRVGAAVAGAAGYVAGAARNAGRRVAAPVVAAGHRIQNAYQNTNWKRTGKVAGYTALGCAGVAAVVVGGMWLADNINKSRKSDDDQAAVSPVPTSTDVPDAGPVAGGADAGTAPAPYDPGTTQPAPTVTAPTRYDQLKTVTPAEKVTIAAGYVVAQGGSVFVDLSTAVTQDKDGFTRDDACTAVLQGLYDQMMPEGLGRTDPFVRNGFVRDARTICDTVADLSAAGATYHVVRVTTGMK